MKRFKITLALFLLCVMAVFGFTACKDNGGSLSVTGVYYLYENDAYDKSDYYELLSNKDWRDNDGETGTYSVSGGTITFYYSFDGETEALFDGTISNGVIYIADLECYYCKEGKTPSENSGSSENGNGQSETQYTVTYNANGGTFADGETTLTATVKNNSTLTAPDSPTRTNYTFAGWATNSAGSNKWKFSTDKVTGDITLYATWLQESAAILSVDGASIDGLNIFMFVDKNTDSVSLASKVVCSDDSVWKLYYDKLGQVEIPTKIAADISGELLDGDNLFYMVVTSQDGTQVNVYELNVYRSYAINVCYYDGDTLLKTETAYTGYEFTPNYIPTITGYKFNDWNYEPRILRDDLELYADKTANTYTVTYDVNGGDELAATEKMVVYDSDYIFTKPKRTGYTFLGWYYGETQLTNEKGDSLAVWNYAKNLTVKAKWQANEYAVTLNTNNESAGTVTGSGNYAYDSNVTITARMNIGYTWLGWYDENDEFVTDELSYLFKMGSGATFTAKWEVSEEMRGFSFSSSESTCTINDVIDNETTQIIIPNYVTEINYVALGSCQNLTNIIVEKNNVHYLSIDGNLYKRGELYGRDTMELIRYARGKTDSSFIIPNGTTSIGAYALHSCRNLTSVTISDSVTDIGECAFGYSVNLASVKIGEKVTSIGKRMFAGCVRLANLEFGSSVRSIEEGAFRDSGLTSLTIPDKVTFIGDFAFDGCSRLKNLVFPNSLKSIGQSMLAYCSSLTSVVIPDSVTSIGDFAFYYCDSLTSVYYQGTASDWSKISINSFNTKLTNATRYYYRETEPTTSGKYWHYDENGEIVIWGYTGKE